MDQTPPEYAAHLLTWVLRVVGFGCLCATIVVLLPVELLSEWRIQLGLGQSEMGRFEETLARYGAMLCGGQGGLWCVLSLNVRKYRQVILYQAAFISILSLASFGLAWNVGLPLLWFTIDLVSCLFVAVLILVCVSKISDPP